jgi:hypothetical protein
MEMWWRYTGVESKLKAGWPKNRGSIPGGDKNCSILHSVQTGSGSRQVSYPVSPGGSILGLKRPGCEAVYLCEYSCSPFYILVSSLFWPHLWFHLFLLFSHISFTVCFVGHNSFRNAVSSHPPFISSIILVQWEKSQLWPYTFVYYSILLQSFTDFKKFISAAWILVKLLIFILEDSSL